MAGKYDIVIEQGATFNLQFKWLDAEQQPIVLTDYKARMQVRYNKKSGDLATEATTENGRIVIDPANALVDVTIEATETEQLQIIRSYYDLEMVAPDNTVYRVLEGKVTISEEVTR